MTTNTVTRLTRKEKIAQGLPKPEGNRKKRAAEARKELMRTVPRAALMGLRGSPRKMRYLVDVIRGKTVQEALNFLTLNIRAGAEPLKKLLISAMSNYEQIYGVESINPSDVLIKTIYVNPGLIMRRVRPAPQGRAYRVRKRFCHVHVVLASNEQTPIQEQNVSQN